MFKKSLKREFKRVKEKNEKGSTENLRERTSSI